MRGGAVSHSPKISIIINIFAGIVNINAEILSKNIVTEMKTFAHGIKIVENFRRVCYNGKLWKQCVLTM